MERRSTLTIRRDRAERGSGSDGICTGSAAASRRLRGDVGWTTKARLTQAGASERRSLLCGPTRVRQWVGDIGETVPCFTGADGSLMVLVVFVSANGKSEWDLDAYGKELQPVEGAAPPPDART